MRPVAQFLIPLALSLSSAVAASLHGVVLDPAGRPIPHSRVIVFARGGQQRITTIANGEGKYAVDPLGAGQYLVQADAPGMTGKVAANVTLGDADATSL